MLVEEELSRPETPGRPYFMTTCKNCANTFEGNYCPNCSQKAETHRFTLKHFAHDFFHAFTHADKGIFFLGKELFIRPGKVAREFNEGKRKKYFNPITYLLLVLALQVYLANLSGINTFYADRIYEMNQSKEVAANSAEFHKIMEVWNTVQRKMYEHGKLVNITLIPILSFFVWLMYRKSESNYAEVLVMNVMYTGQALLIFIVMCILPFVLYKDSILITTNLYMLTSVVFMAVLLKQFYQQSWWKTILKTIVAQLLYYIVVFLLMAAVTVAVLLQ